MQYDGILRRFSYFHYARVIPVQGVPYIPVDFQTHAGFDCLLRRVTIRWPEGLDIATPVWSMVRLQITDRGEHRPQETAPIPAPLLTTPCRVPYDATGTHTGFRKLHKSVNFVIPNNDGIQLIIHYAPINASLPGYVDVMAETINTRSEYEPING